MFRRSLITVALAAAFPVVHADPHVHELAPVVVTGNPLGSNLFDLVAPVTTVSQEELSRTAPLTLGDALRDKPGISASSFGPNASRPVIRGQDAERVRILQNGTGSMDVSALSPDHAVPIDPLVIDQIEVVRGPAALLYGGSAIGGVVNALDNRIPQEAIKGVTGRAELRSGGAERQTSGAVVMEAGNGNFALHIDGFKRDTDDLRIPGFARSERLRTQSPQATENRDRLVNSSSKSDGAALGAAYTFGNGYVGASYSGYNSNYGTVAEEAVRIDMRSNRFDLAGEVNALSGFFTKVKARFSNTDYQHQEIDAGTIATTFKNQGNEGMIEATHRKIGNLTGVIGFSAHQNKVQAIGDEALIPLVNQNAQAVYLFEELGLEKFKLNFGGRVEHVRLKSDGGGSIDGSTGNPRFGDAEKIGFTPKSAAVGAVVPLSAAFNVAANLSHTERAPSYSELFANGPHAATGQYEVGDRSLKLEKANGLDLQLRWKQGKHSATVGGFYTRYQNFITLFSTGNNRDDDGTVNPGGDLAEAVTRAVPAVFKGLETEGKFHLYEGAGDLDLRLKADMVRAHNADTGAPLPRISPWHLGAGLDYRLGNFSARIDALYGAKQSRVAANELPTDSYVQLNAQASYKLRTGLPSAEVFVRANNLLNEDIRLHTSTLKDRAPLGGRSVLVGIRSSF